MKIVLRGLLVVMTGLLLVLALALAWLKWRHGGGEPYPGVATPPLVPASALETLVTLDYPPGNVAVAPDGRVFFNLHPFAKAERFGGPAMFELVAGKPQPFPDSAYQQRFQGVFGMTVDRQNRLWLIEPAGLDHAQTRLTAFDLATKQAVFEHSFAKGQATFAQDLRVSPDGKTVVLADTGLFQFTPACLWLLDVASKTTFQRLTGHTSTSPQDWVIRTRLGPHKLGFGLVNFAVGIDGIEISADGQWLYYGAMSHSRLYRVPLAALLDRQLDEAALAKRIEDLGAKPLSDGITLDAAGRVILTDIEHGGLMRREADGRVQTLVASPAVIWADGVVAAPDGALLFTDSAIPAYIDQLARPPAKERLEAGRPYRIYRLRLPG